MSKIKIMLDPGHDKAKYNQSPVVPAYWEGARMWRLSQFLRLALVAKGFEVGCTKSKCDQAVTVTQRGAMGRGYDALISLHSNACGSEFVDRPVGIYFVDDDCGKVDGQSKTLAKRLSAVVAKVMGTSDPQQYSRLSKNDRDHDGRKNDDYYGVLFAAHQAKVPAIILENSFHTNRRAAQWLLSDANLRKLANALADDLADYFGVKAPGKLPADPDTGKVDHAQSFSKAKAGTYRVKASSGLHLRTGASSKKESIEVMKNGSKVTCYGYYTGKWLLVVSATGKTGFCHSGYLVKL